MENDKLTVRERLIDFLKWYEYPSITGDYTTGLCIDEYLKSINESSGEALTLAPIEDEDKVCVHHFLKIGLFDNTIRWKCKKCGYEK